jgi:hypothetical protein
VGGVDVRSLEAERTKVSVKKVDLLCKGKPRGKVVRVRVRLDVDVEAGEAICGKSLALACKLAAQQS